MWSPLSYRESTLRLIYPNTYIPNTFIFASQNETICFKKKVLLLLKTALSGYILLVVYTGIITRPWKMNLMTWEIRYQDPNSSWHELQIGVFESLFVIFSSCDLFGFVFVLGAVMMIRTRSYSCRCCGILVFVCHYGRSLRIHCL